jgi:hypothetical protein
MVHFTSGPKDERGQSQARDLRVLRPRAAPPVGSPGVAGTYPTLCFRCHRLVMLSPEQAVIAEARAIVGDCTFAFCGRCIRHAAARMVDELGG